VVAIADNSAPANFLTAPLDGAVVAGSFSVAVDATEPYFASVECFVGGTSLGDVSTSPTFSATVSLASIIDGPLTVTCTATDAAGGTGSQSVTVIVRDWTEHVTPERLNVDARGGLVTMSVRGPNVSLLQSIGGQLTLSVPGASPILVAAAHFHGTSDDGDCDDRSPSHVDLKFDRGAVAAAVRAALATGAIVEGKPFPVELLQGNHVIGSDNIVAIRRHDR
jgi:hypothetical protein